MPFAPITGGQIHYRLNGNQELPALVLSNSLGTDLSMWDLQVPVFTRPFHDREPDTVDRFRKILEATRPESYVATCAAIRDADLRGEVSKIRAQTLVITGTQDKATPPEGGRYLTERIAGSKYVELD